MSNGKRDGEKTEKEMERRDRKRERKMETLRREREIEIFPNKSQRPLTY